MLNTSEADGTISRYRLKMKTASWLRKKELDDLVAEAGIVTHVRDNKWKGKYYLTSEVAEKLAEITEIKTKQLRAAADELTNPETKPW